MEDIQETTAPTIDKSHSPPALPISPAFSSISPLPSAPPPASLNITDLITQPATRQIF